MPRTDGQETSARSGRPALALLLASALWGTSGTAQALADLPVSPAVVGAVRLAVGAAALLLFSLASGALRAYRSYSRRAWAWVGLAVGCAAVYQVAFFSAVARTGVAAGTLVALGCATISCGLLDRLVNKVPLTLRWTAGAFVALVGTGLLALPGREVAFRADGVVLAGLAGLCYGGYTVAVKRRLAAGEAPLPLLTATLTGAALVLLPILLRDSAPLLSGTGLLLSAWLGIGATAVAYLLFVRGLAGTSAATAGVLSLAEPLVAAALGIGVLGEQLSVSAAAGTVLIGCGLVIVALPQRSQAARD